MNSTHKPEEPDYPHLDGRHEYQITPEVSVVVEDGMVRFFRDDEEVLVLSEWDHTEFDIAYVGDRIDQIVQKMRTKDPS